MRKNIKNIAIDNFHCCWPWFWGSKPMLTLRSSGSSSKGRSQGSLWTLHVRQVAFVVGLSITLHCLYYYQGLQLHHQWGRPAHVPWTEDFSHLLQYQHSLLGVVWQKGPGECGSQHLPGSLSSSRFAKNFQHFPLFVKVFTVLTFLGWETTSATLGWVSQGWDFVMRAVSCYSIQFDTLASYHA